MIIYPSGIIPFSGSINTCSEASNFSELFPALANRVLVAASSCFLVPGFRDVLVSHGVVDCSRFNCENWIRNGHSIFVYPGGAKEGLYSNPGCDWLDLRRRLGFIRLALRFNIPVVPSYTFNEVDAYSQLSYLSLENHFPVIHRFRLCFQRTLGIAAPIFTHLIPNRCKSNFDTVTVIGKPLHLPCCHDRNDPTDEEIRKCLDLYINNLQDLYNKYSHVYNSTRRSLLVD